MLGRQFDELLPDGQMGVIPSRGPGIPRLGFRASSEPIGLELAFLAFQLFDLLLQRGNAVEGIAMTRLPISDLLAELEILALQAPDSGA